MMVAAWLLLGLLTVTARVLGSDARDMLQSELEDWWPLGLARGRRDVSKCGIPTIEPSVNVRVVGGLPAVPHSWPWMVSLQSLGGHLNVSGHFCGGSLINDQWVLSAAHCLIGFKGGSAKWVEVGLHNQSNHDEYTRSIPIAEIFMNDKFDRPGRPLTSDFMLLKLVHPVQLNDAVTPVCLPQPFQVFSSANLCYGTGWGHLQFQGVSPDVLQQVRLPLIDLSVCNQTGWYDGEIDDSMVCAGYEHGGRDTCQGDSGGPLVCKEDNHWVLYGVTSWGEGCASANSPGVYGRVSPYIKWINEIISKNSY